MHLSKPTSTFTNNAAQTRRRGDQPQENEIEMTLFKKPITRTNDTDAHMSTFLPLGDQLKLRLVSRGPKNAVDTGNPITKIKCRNSQTLAGHIDGVLSVIDSSDGRIATTYLDNTAKIWDATTGTCLFTLAGHTRYISSLATLSDGRIVTGSADRTAKIWDIETRTLGQDD